MSNSNKRLSILDIGITALVLYLSVVIMLTFLFFRLLGGWIGDRFLVPHAGFWDFLLFWPLETFMHFGHGIELFDHGVVFFRGKKIIFYPDGTPFIAERLFDSVAFVVPALLANAAVCIGTPCFVLIYCFKKMYARLRSKRSRPPRESNNVFHKVLRFITKPAVKRHYVGVFCIGALCSSVFGFLLFAQAQGGNLFSFAIPKPGYLKYFEWPPPPDSFTTYTPDFRCGLSQNSAKACYFALHTVTMLPAFLCGYTYEHTPVVMVAAAHVIVIVMILFGTLILILFRICEKVARNKLLRRYIKRAPPTE